jgi:hypothetical protein
MLAVLLVVGGLALPVAFYVYGMIVDRHRPTQKVIHRMTKGRDMWTATLLDCDFEPAKARFGPAKAIPAGRVVYHVDHKEEFSKHMSTK